MLLTLASLAPSSSFRAVRLPWRSKVICAVSSPWGSKVICCSPYGTIVLDSIWLTSLSVEHSGPVTHLNHWNSSALLRLCFDVFFWLVFPTFSLFTILPLRFSRGRISLLIGPAPPPSSFHGSFVSNTWLRLVFDTWRPFWVDSEVALDSRVRPSCASLSG